MTEAAVWMGAGSSIQFGPNDVEILDLVVGLKPELRICALAVKRARELGVTYPIDSRDGIVDLLGGELEVELGGHQISVASIHRYIPDEHLPIRSEGELISRVYIALGRCNREFHIASSTGETSVRGT